MHTHTHACTRVHRYNPVQDTPGYGDDLDIMNHVAMMTRHLDACNERWLAMESARDRAQDLTEVSSSSSSSSGGGGGGLTGTCCGDTL